METEDCPDQDQGFQHDYDDDHDSDVEARLYAEVYYSNTIIGEENNTNNSIPKNQCPSILNDFNKSSSNNQDHLLHGKKTTQHNSNENICDSSLAVSNGSTDVILNKKNTTKEANTQSTNNFSKESISTHKVNNLSKIPNYKKRASENCLNDSNKFSKKKKYENQNGARELQSSQFSESSNEQRPNQHKNDIVQCDDSAVINPYNKNLIDNGQRGMKLLSSEFINLVFAGRSKRRKMKDYPVRKGRSKRTNTYNVISNSDIMQQPLNMKPVENNLDEDCSTKSAVINISSESSNESFESDSKYNTIVATDKKVKQRESGLKNIHDASDSEESIFEVPVPPKPTPPVIEVKDSDNENQNESDEDSFLNDSFISQEIVVQNDLEISLDSTMNKTQDTCEIVSDSDDSNGLILNCTKVQKGVSSLNEIRKMNQQTLNSIQGNSSSSNSHSIEHPQNKSESSNNTAVTEKSSISSKSKQKKQSSNKNISPEEYFFQPMNERMKSFYNDSWGGENFDMDKIKSNMSTDPSKWAILNKDLVLTGYRKKRYFGMVCARCHKDGHRQNDCPEPNKGPTCYMCGENGHFATYCPQTKCLTCGRTQTMYRTTCGYCEKLFCTRCRSQGHKDDSCPDLWRRYHHTTNTSAPKIPLNVKNVMKSKQELFCCNCTKRGHDSLACRKLRWSQHFPSPSFVTYYSGPTYSAVTNLDTPPIVDNVQENPCSLYDKHNNSSNCDNLFRNSMTSSIVPTSVPRSDRRNEHSIIQNREDHSLSVTDPNKNVIFNICGKKQTKFNGETQSMKDVRLKLNVPDKSNEDSVKEWKKLSDFLKGLVSDMPAEFRLEWKDKKLFMYVKTSRKYIEYLCKLIKQYSNRNDFERSQMLLSGERTLTVIVGHLSRKFAEMKNLNEDISTLCEETRRLRQELLVNEGQIQNEIYNRLKQNEFVFSQQKLLMLLYREGFGDQSLGQLRKLFLKMKKAIEENSSKRKMKKNSKYVPAIPLVSFKSLFAYLHYYNNIFVPQEFGKLDSYIQKYKDHLDTRHRLFNSSLLFPQGTSNEKQCNCNEVSIQDNISNGKTLSEDSSQSLSSLMATSQELPILQNTVTESSVGTINDKPNSLHSELSNQTLVLPKNKTKKNLNCLYLQAIQAKNQNRKEHLMQNFRNFLKNARNYLEKASKLNSPRLRDDVINLKRELEDVIYVSTNKVRKFKKKLRTETLRLQGTGKKCKTLETVPR